MTDQIIITELEIHCNIGCTEQERAFPQRLHLNVEVDVDNTTLLSTGKLSYGVCYAGLSESLCSLSQSKPWVYVEELLEAMSERTFKNYPAALAITLEMRKYAVPGVASTGVRIKRQRR